MKNMTENGNKGKTQLSLDANVNYARLAKHIVWMEKKGLIESRIDKSKINVRLTEKGRAFASTLSSEDVKK
jgi:predicted transcriptional regulator